MPTFARFVLKVTGPEATYSCKYGQLCVGLKAVIDGAVHGVQSILYSNATEENWGFLLVNAKNSFNKINQIGMLWTIYHLCPFGDSFVCNCYRHHSSVVLINGDGAENSLHSWEGVMQGDSLDMVACGIEVLPLIKRLKLTYPDVTHPKYADNSRALHTFNNYERYFNSLKRHGLDRGYYPDPTKSILIVHPNNIKA